MSEGVREEDGVGSGERCTEKRSTRELAIERRRRALVDEVELPFEVMDEEGERTGVVSELFDSGFDGVRTRRDLRRLRLDAVEKLRVGAGVDFGPATIFRGLGTWQRRDAKEAKNEVWWWGLVCSLAEVGTKVVVFSS